MSNSSLFSPGPYRNEAGGTAHKLTPKAALAQLASTSCLNNTLYVSGEKQLNDVLAFANKCEPAFVAKVAVYSREKHGMKDIPALLCAVLAANRQEELFKKVFPRVINNGDMLRNFFQMIRSGQVGRRSFGTLPKRLMTSWFNSRTPAEVFDQSVGTPSMRDILRCIRPKPLDRTRSAMYAWFVDKKYDESLLPAKVREFEKWKATGGDVPHVPFQMLTSQPLDAGQWTDIAKRAGWFWLLKNLNNMVKHGVFEQYGMTEFVAKRLADRTSILKAKAFPYRILTAYQNTKDIPHPIREALHAALEVATENVPQLPECKGGNAPVYLLVDVSKSMTYPVTGERYGSFNRANTSVRCVDVASLIACCILRRNKGAQMLCFNTKVVDVHVDPVASVMDNATRIGKIATGGTACSAPMHVLNEMGSMGDLVVIVSDNQSWCESMHIDRNGRRQPGKTPLQVQWEKWKDRNPKAKMVCLDVAPYVTTQVQESKDVLNLGGFSDTAFSLIDSFAKGTMGEDHLIGVIESLDLDEDPATMNDEE